MEAMRCINRHSIGSIVKTLTQDFVRALDVSMKSFVDAAFFIIPGNMKTVDGLFGLQNCPCMMNDKIESFPKVKNGC